MRKLKLTLMRKFKNYKDKLRSRYRKSCADRNLR